MNPNHSYINQNRKIEIKDIHKIGKLYENRTYFSEYGFSVFVFIFVTFAIILICGFCYLMNKVESVRADWINQRCNPYVIPFAGFINKPDNMTIVEFTQQNYDFCNQTILESQAGEVLEPLTYITKVLANVTKDTEKSVQHIRAMFNKTRTNIQNVSTDLMQRLLSITAPIQNNFTEFKKVNSQMNNMLTSVLYSSIGNYYTSGLPPTPHCFDENTMIEMNDGSLMPISKIQAGDFLKNKNQVTAKLTLKRLTHKMYDLNGVIVSDSHMVYHKGVLVHISNHLDAILLSSYEKPYLYCLNTSEKRIEMNDMSFLDWDEIISKEDEDMLFLKMKYGDLDSPFNSNSNLNDKNIHKYLDGGFVGSTAIVLNNGQSKEIKNIEIEDVLKNGEKVTGLVEIDGDTLGDQYVYLSSNSFKFEGGPNNIISKENGVFSTLQLKLNSKNKKFGFIEKQKREKKADKLYHLMTDKLTFQIGDLSFYYYNSCIDYLLD